MIKTQRCFTLMSTSVSDSDSCQRSLKLKVCLLRGRLAYKSTCTQPQHGPEVRKTDIIMHSPQKQIISVVLINTSAVKIQKTLIRFYLSHPTESCTVLRLCWSYHSSVEHYLSINRGATSRGGLGGKCPPQKELWPLQFYPLESQDFALCSF